MRRLFCAAVFAASLLSLASGSSDNIDRLPKSSEVCSASTCIKDSKAERGSVSEDVTSLLMTGIQLHKTRAAKSESTANAAESSERDLLTDRAEFIPGMSSSKHSIFSKCRWGSKAAECKSDAEKKNDDFEDMNKIRDWKRVSSPTSDKWAENVGVLDCKDDVQCRLEKTFVPANMLLTLTLVEGKNLHDQDWLTGENDAQCEIGLIDATAQNGYLHKGLTSKEAKNEVTLAQTPRKYTWKTFVVPDDNNPKWNYQFSTAAYVAANEKTGRGADHFVVECWDKDWKIVKKADPLGHTFIGEKQLQVGKNNEFWVTLATEEGGKNFKEMGKLKFKAHWEKCSEAPGDACHATNLVMSSMAGGIYKMSGQVGDWHMIVHKNIVEHGGKDHVGIYKKLDSNECALAFSGSNDMDDWFTNGVNLANVAAIDMCGWQIHKGFAEEAQRYISDPVMDKWSEIIEKKCNGELYIVGHSLGGAVASVVAACANRRKLSSLNTRTDADATWVKDRPFWAKGLYTIGAPAVAETPLTDERSLIEQAETAVSSGKGKNQRQRPYHQKKTEQKRPKVPIFQKKQGPKAPEEAKALADLKPKPEEGKAESAALSDLTHIAGIQLSEPTADNAESSERGVFRRRKSKKHPDRLSKKSDYHPCNKLTGSKKACEKFKAEKAAHDKNHPPGSDMSEAEHAKLLMEENLGTARVEPTEEELKKRMDSAAKGADADEQPKFNFAHGPCFPGLRSFNTDARDLVPAIASAMGYVHPRVDAMDLKPDSDNDKLIKCKDDYLDKDDAVRPWEKGENKYKFTKVWEGIKDTLFQASHSTSTYIGRLSDLVTHHAKELKFW